MTHWIFYASTAVCTIAFLFGIYTSSIFDGKYLNNSQLQSICWTAERKFSSIVGQQEKLMRTVGSLEFMRAVVNSSQVSTTKDRDIHLEIFSQLTSSIATYLTQVNTLTGALSASPSADKSFTAISSDEPSSLPELIQNLYILSDVLKSHSDSFPNSTAAITIFRELSKLEAEVFLNSSTVVKSISVDLINRLSDLTSVALALSSDALSRWQAPVVSPTVPLAQVEELTAALALEALKSEDLAARLETSLFSSAELSRVKEGLEVEVEALQAQLAAQQAAVKTLSEKSSQRVEELQADLTRLTEARSTEQRESEAALRNLKAELASLTARLLASETTVADLTHAATTTARELSDASHEVARLTSQVQHCEAERLQLEAASGACSSALAQVQGDNEANIQQVEACSVEVGSCRDSLDMYAANLTLAEEELVSKRISLLACNRQVSETENGRSKLLLEIHKLKEEVDEQRTALKDRVCPTCDRVEGQVRQLEQDLENLHQLHHDLEDEHRKVVEHAQQEADRCADIDELRSELSRVQTELESSDKNLRMCADTYVPEAVVAERCEAEKAPLADELRLLEQSNAIVINELENQLKRCNDHVEALVDSKLLLQNELSSLSSGDRDEQQLILRLRGDLDAAQENHRLAEVDRANAEGSLNEVHNTLSDTRDLLQTARAAVEDCESEKNQLEDELHRCSSQRSDCPATPPAPVTAASIPIPIRRIDFASKASGAQVLRRLSSPTFVPTNVSLPLFLPKSVLGFLGLDDSDSVGQHEDALSEDMRRGSCWPLQGSRGTLVVKLKQPVLVDSISIEHLSRVDGTDVGTAPMDFDVYGKLSLSEDMRYLVSGRYIVADEDTTRLQMFPLPRRAARSRTTVSSESESELVQYLFLEVASNHGNPDYTCLYRFMAHGQLPLKNF